MGAFVALASAARSIQGHYFEYVDARLTSIWLTRRA